MKELTMREVDGDELVLIHDVLVRVSRLLTPPGGNMGGDFMTPIVWPSWAGEWPEGYDEDKPYMPEVSVEHFMFDSCGDRERFMESFAICMCHDLESGSYYISRHRAGECPWRSGRFR